MGSSKRADQDNRVLLLEIGRGRRTGSAATPSLAVLGLGLAHLRDRGHARCSVASRNEPRKLGLRLTTEVKPGTVAALGHAPARRSRPPMNCTIN
jgi:hypothetical protein